jgi:hypothetical protein
MPSPNQPGKVTVEDVNVYWDGEPTPEQAKAAAGTTTRTGRMPGPDLSDDAIASDAFRIQLLEGEAAVAVTIAPGTTLGEVVVHVQHEGKKAEARFGPNEQLRIRNACMDGQNDLIDDVCRAIQDWLGEAAGNWRLTVDAEPCPHATAPFRLVESLRKIGTIQTTAPTAAPDRRTQPQVEPGQTLRPGE